MSVYRGAAAVYQHLLQEYLAAEPVLTRLLADEVENVFDFFDVMPEHEEPLRRFLQARAHGSARGRRLDPKTIEIRDQILALQDEYDRMTVRQIFYRLMTRGVVPKTEEQGYDPVQRQVLSLRRQGFLPWAFIADGTRWVSAPEMWDSIEDALAHTAHTYRRNLLRAQGVRIEIWLEKDALASLLRPTTFAWGVRLMVSRGQSSETYVYNAAQEAQQAWERTGVETVVYALYDSDVYGRSAAAKIEEKLAEYSEGTPIMFELLAVTDDQIRDWNLPTRPAKRKGDPPAVELDAIDPPVLIQLVDDAIASHVDEDAWEKERIAEESEREILHRMAGLD